MSATSIWSTFRRHAAQTIPLEFGSRSGEGHSMQIRRNYPKSFWTLIIHGDMARHGSYPVRNLITHRSPASKAGVHQTCQTRHSKQLANVWKWTIWRFAFPSANHIIPENAIPEKPSDWGKSETRFQALLPITLRPRAIVPVGVHRGPFGEQKLRSRDVAVARRPVERRRASGGFPGAATAKMPTARETTKVVRMLSSVPVQPTNERWMFLDSTSSNLFKTKNIHKQSQTHSTSFNLVSGKLPSTKGCP